MYYIDLREKAALPDIPLRFSQHGTDIHLMFTNMHSLRPYPVCTLLTLCTLLRIHNTYVLPAPPPPTTHTHHKNGIPLNTLILNALFITSTPCSATMSTTCKIQLVLTSLFLLVWLISPLFSFLSLGLVISSVMHRLFHATKVHLSCICTRRQVSHALLQFFIGLYRKAKHIRTLSERLSNRILVVYPKESRCHPLLGILRCGLYVEQHLHHSH